jgi:tRNA pseudouridine55 synthase
MKGPSNPGIRVDGVLLLDKPRGLTSNQALQRVKRLFRARKAGHTGSLDPLATGMLPICMGEATKLSAYLLDADKLYEVSAVLGVATTTADADGEVLETRPVPELDRATLEKVLIRYQGDIEQVPPMYSALKHQGRRLYDLARAGVEVERKPRRVSIHELRLLELGEGSFSLRLRCSKGTYVRTLVADMGEDLGCGAHVQALRRLAVGPYEAGSMVTLEQLEEAAAAGDEQLRSWLRGLDSALQDWPAVTLDADSAYYLQRGQPVLVPRAPGAGRVRIYAGSGVFLGVGEVLDDGRIAPRRLIRPPAAEQR